MDMSVEKMTVSETLAEWYLKESWSEVHGRNYGDAMAMGFRERLRDGERVGQAFYNMLRPSDQTKVASTIHDPFHGGVVKTHQCIDFLTTKRREA